MLILCFYFCGRIDLLRLRKRGKKMNKIDKQIVNYKAFAIIAMWLFAAMAIVAVIYAIKVNYIGSILAIVIGIICLVGNILADKRCQKLRLIKLDK